MTDPAAPGPKLQPCLAELLRTCVHPPALVLKVEHVFPAAADDDDRSRTEEMATRDHIQDQATSHDDHDSDPETQKSTPHCLRLALSDGELQIQAVLATNLHTKELLELRRGDLLEVKRFQVRTARRVNGHGRVIYLGVDACEWTGNTVGIADEDLGGGFIPEEDHERVIEKGNLPSSSAFLSSASRTNSTDRSELDREEDTLTAEHARDSIATMGPLNVNRKRTRESQDLASNLAKRRSSKPLTTPRPTVRFATPRDVLDDSDDDDFETIFVSQSTIQQRREVLRNVGQNTPSSVVTTKAFQLFDGKGADEDVADDMSTSQDKKTAKTEEKGQEGIVGLPPSNISSHHHHPPKAAIDAPTSSTANTHLAPPAQLTHPQPPPQPPTEAATSLRTNNAPPLHTLSTLLHSHTLPRRNYTCSVLGLITWISPSLIHKPNSPFPPKRHIKIHDASISSRRVGVTVAVYVDAREFVPDAGTVALFRGVTMQRWEDEVILNAYEHLKDAGDEWFVCDEVRLEEMGHDVKGLRRWWVERKEGKTSGSVNG
jgi:hypothetical protein